MVLFLMSSLYSVQTVEDAGFAGEHILTYQADSFVTAIGKAGCSLQGSSSYSYWNPSGIYGVERPEIKLTSTKLPAGTRWDFFSFARRIYKKLYLGASYFQLSTKGIENTDDFGQVLGYINEIRSGYLFTFSLPANPFITLGLNLKVVYHNFGEFHDSGYGFDVGANFKIPFKGMKAGFTYYNIVEPRLKIKNTFEKFSASYRFGFLIPILKEKLNLYMDAILIDVYSRRRTWRGYFGADYKIFDIFKIGLGYEKRGSSFGIKFLFKDVSLSYSAVFQDIDTVHNFSLEIKLGLTPEEERIIANERKRKKVEELLSVVKYYFDRKDFDKVIEYADKILKMDRSNKEAIDFKEKARRILNERRAEELFEEAKDYFLTGKEMISNEKLREAERLSPGIKKRKEDFYYKKAEEYLNGAEYEKCEKALSIVIWLNPDNKEALDMLKRVKKIKEMLK